MLFLKTKLVEFASTCGFWTLCQAQPKRRFPGQNDRFQMQSNNYKANIVRRAKEGEGQCLYCTHTDYFSGRIFIWIILHCFKTAVGRARQVWGLMRKFLASLVQMNFLLVLICELKISSAKDLGDFLRWMPNILGFFISATEGQFLNFVCPIAKYWGPLFKKILVKYVWLFTLYFFSYRDCNEPISQRKLEGHFWRASTVIRRSFRSCI